MTGISEILVLILLITGILIIPRMFKPEPKAASAALKKPVPVLSMKIRAGIVVSLVFPLIAALILKPWTGNLVIFISVSILPVLIAWAVYWVMTAQKK